MSVFCDMSAGGIVLLIVVRLSGFDRVLHVLSGMANGD